jgi:hypothetical protein
MWVLPSPTLMSALGMDTVFKVSLVSVMISMESAIFSKCSGDCPPEIGFTEPWLWGGRTGGLECQILISCAWVFYQTTFFCTQVGSRGRFSKFIEPHFSV